MIVDKSNARSSQLNASRCKRGVKSVCDVGPAPVFLEQRGSEVPFLFEAGSDLGHVPKSVIVSSRLKRWVKSHRALKSGIITVGQVQMRRGPQSFLSEVRSAGVNLSLLSSTGPL